MNPVHPCWAPIGMRRLKAGVAGLKGISNLTTITAIAAILAAAALVTGCANPGTLPPALPALTASAAGLDAGMSTSFPSETWWQELGDPKLNALIDQALAGQPSLAVAQARLARADAGLAALKAGQGPQAGLGLDASRQRYSEHGLIPPPLAGGVYNSANLQANASVELDFFGRHQPALQAALSQQQAASADRQAARVLLVAQVAQAYVGLARLAAMRELTQQTLTQRQSVLALTRQRESAGLDTRLELRLAEGALPDARAQIEAWSGQMVLARHQLATLSGQAPDALSDLSPNLSPLRSSVPPAHLGADLLGRRADVVAARWRVEAAGQDIELARAQFYPDINLVGFVGLNAIGLDRLLQLGSRNLGVGPALRLPLFDGGRLRANLQGRAADADAAVAAYNGAVLAAAREVADASATLQSVARQQADQALALAATEDAFELARQRYGAGLSTQLAVLAAETGVLAQRQQAAELVSRRLVAQVALMQALGGGWTGADGPPPALRVTTAPRNPNPALP